MRLTYWQPADQESEPECVTVREAKRLLKEKGGRAWTENYERDGTMFEVSPVLLKGNNSKFEYNRHL